MPIIGGLDIHRRQLTFDYPGTVTGQARRGQVAPADREHIRNCIETASAHIGNQLLPARLGRPPCPADVGRWRSGSQVRYPGKL
jgi:hypothetical protein